MKITCIIVAATLFLSASADQKPDKKALKQALKQAKLDAKRAKPAKAKDDRAAQVHQLALPEGNTYTYYSNSILPDFEKPVMACPLSAGPNGGFRAAPSGAAALGGEDYTKYVFYYRSFAGTAWAAAPCLQEPHTPWAVPTVAEVLPNGETATVLTVDGSAYATGEDVIAAFKIPATRAFGENGQPGVTVGYCVTSTAPTVTVRSTTIPSGGSTGAADQCEFVAGVANCGGWDACTGLSPNTTGPYVKLGIDGMPGQKTPWGGLTFDPRGDYYTNSQWRYNMYNPSRSEYAVTLRDWSTLLADATVYKPAVDGVILPVADPVILKYGSASPGVFISAGMRFYNDAYFAYPYTGGSQASTTSANYLNLQVGCPNQGVLETRYIILNWRYLASLQSTTSGNLYHTGATYLKLVCDRRAIASSAPVDPTNRTQVMEALADANTTAEVTAILLAEGIAYASSQGNRCNSACANGLPTACNASNNDFVCSKCLSVDSCSKAVGSQTTGRQAELNGVLFVACPQLTRLEQSECFAQAACNGLINHDIDACTMNGVTFVCPVCPGDSKKGLLGLLGLLGLIPLLCLSLLCCLLLLSIRRKKSQGDVLLATFDSQAPGLCTTTGMEPYPCGNTTVFA